jgi:hypothetical protein
MSGAPESILSDAEQRDLQRLAGFMVPADAAFGVPGADDALIFDDILRSLGRDLAPVRLALARLRDLAGGDFATLDDAAAETAAMALLATQDATTVALGRAVLQCYYRDDRVVRSLGLEPRAPFPLGHTLEQGDWSLLEAVRGRARMWRDLDGTGR